MLRKLATIISLLLVATTAPILAQDETEGREDTSDATHLLDSRLIAEIESVISPAETSKTGAPFIEKYISISGSQTYFVQRGFDAAGNCSLEAIDITELMASENFEETAIFATHTCTGAPCNSCEIVYKWWGGFSHCKCNQAGAGNTCNHSVSS